MISFSNCGTELLGVELLAEPAASEHLNPIVRTYILNLMCSRVQCPTCNRPSYAGCGNHVEQVLGDVAPADRCECNGGAASSSPSMLSRFRR